MPGTPTDTDESEETVEFELSSVVIVAGIIGATVVLAVAVIVCGVVYIQKYRCVKSWHVSVGMSANV